MSLMSKPRQRIFGGEWLKILTFVILIAAAWSVAYNKTSLEAWKLPVRYESDALLVMGWVKAASDGSFIPAVPKNVTALGAPFSANWNDWPVVDETLYFLTGMVSRLIGIAAACNLAVLLAHLLAGLSFYWVCRYMRYSWEWSMAGCIAFAFSQYLMVRSLQHITLTYCWHIPLCLLVTWWAASRSGIGFSGKRFWISAGVAAATGLQNPYYTSMFLQFMGFAILIQAIHNRSFLNCASAAFIGAVACAGFMLMNVDTLYHSYSYGTNDGAVRRSYADLEKYALKPIEMFLPYPRHVLDFLQIPFKNYSSGAFFKGEMTCPNLGIIGVVAFVWLAIKTFYNATRRPCLRIPTHALQIGWVLAYSVIGGVNCILGLFGMFLFRGTNRFSIVILALCLLFLIRELTILGRGWKPSTRLAIFLVLLSTTFIELIPWRDVNITMTSSTCSTTFKSDEQFTQTMEKLLPRGSMVFQLPVTKYPENGPVAAMKDYSHLRPYLHSNYLRFSYGDTKGRGTQEWQFDVQKLTPEKMVEVLESYGFSAIYINTKGYKDNGRGLIAGLRKTGRKELVVSPDGDLLCIKLNPSPDPSLPGKSIISSHGS